MRLALGGVVLQRRSHVQTPYIHVLHSSIHADIKTEASAFLMIFYWDLCSTGVSAILLPSQRSGKYLCRISYLDPHVCFQIVSDILSLCLFFFFFKLFHSGILPLIPRNVSFFPCRGRMLFWSSALLHSLWHSFVGSYSRFKNKNRTVPFTPRSVRTAAWEGERDFGRYCPEVFSWAPGCLQRICSVDPEGMTRLEPCPESPPGQC